MVEFKYNKFRFFSPHQRLLFSDWGINMKSFTIKHITMKKLLLVLAIGSFAACNGSSSTDAKTDSTVAKADSAVTAVADSAKSAIDSTAKAAMDTLKAKVDSVKK